jgi:hypothetical protein
MCTWLTLMGVTIGVTSGWHAHTCQVDFELPDDSDRESSLNMNRDSGTSKARSRGSTGNPEMKLKLMLNHSARPNLEKYATALDKHKHPSWRPLILQTTSGPRPYERGRGPPKVFRLSIF